MRLGGEVRTVDFEAILRGNLPDGTSVGRIINGSRVHSPGWDLTFSAPKSASVMALVAGDNRVVEAHRRAVEATLKYLEEAVATTRIFNAEHQTQIETAASALVAATFLHDTSRAADPQLHTHSIIANLCLGADQKWRSINSLPIYRNKMLLGQIYRNEFAANLQQLGYQVVRTGQHGEFELVGVPKEICQHFSKRSEEIRSAVLRGDEASAAELERAALATRKSKKQVDRSSLRLGWLTEMVQQGWHLDDLPLPKPALPRTSDPSCCVSLAIAHLAERRSVFSKDELLLAALRFGLGTARAEDIAEAMQQLLVSGKLVAGSDGHFTTPGALKLETGMLEQAHMGRKKSAPILQPLELERKLGGASLTQGQASAIHTVITTVDRLVAVQGAAGSGKTTMMKKARELAEYAGWRIEGLAPQISAATKLRDESGIACGTLQSFLTRYQGISEGREIDAEKLAVLRKKYRSTLLVCDEASFISTRQMRDFLTIANVLEVGRVALIGDHRQLDGVEAGKPFHLLQKAGLRTAQMQENMRQKHDRHRAAVAAIQDGDVVAALKNLQGEIHEGKDQNYAIAAADAWLALSHEQRAKTLLISPTHALRHSMTARIRETMVNLGELGEEARQLVTLKPESYTLAQRIVAGAYHTGQIVRFNRSYKALGVEAGDYLAVSAVNEHRGEVLLSNGEATVAWKPSQLAARTDGAVEVYRASEIELREGDKVRFTRAQREAGVARNDQAVVTRIDGDKVEIQTSDGRRRCFSADAVELMHIDHDWTATVHSAQGQSVDNVIGVIGSSQPFAANQKMFYVEISRIRHGIQIFTDDAERLRKSLEENTGEQLAALEIVRQEKSTDLPALEGQNRAFSGPGISLEEAYRYRHFLDENERERSLW